MGEQPTEPGWYDDPEGGADQAYWDGDSWSLSVTRPEETYRRSVRTAAIATSVFVLIWLAVIFVTNIDGYPGTGYLIGLFAAVAGGAVTVFVWGRVGGLAPERPPLAQLVAAPVSLVVTIYLGLFVLLDCDVATSLAAQFAAFVLGPAAGITALALWFRISVNQNSQGRKLYAVLFTVSLIVCVLYWLGAFLALTLGSSMCGESWGWFW